MPDMKPKQLEGIRNPLAVIAIFAGISEVAMAVTLLKLPFELQEIFVWFVMGFPLILVTGFFFVLYRKPAVLFSPGDYQDDKLYLDSISPNGKETTITNGRLEQIEASVQALQVGLDRLADKTPGGKEVKEELAEEKERQQALLSLKNNNLFSFLKDEIGLSDDQITTLVKQSTSIHALPEHLLKLTSNKWKTDRLTGVIDNFPQAISDFDILRKIVATEA